MATSEDQAESVTQQDAVASSERFSKAKLILATILRQPYALLVCCLLLFVQCVLAGKVGYLGGNTAIRILCLSLIGGLIAWWIQRWLIGRILLSLGLVLVGTCIVGLLIYFEHYMGLPGYSSFFLAHQIPDLWAEIITYFRPLHLLVILPTLIVIVFVNLRKPATEQTSQPTRKQIMVATALGLFLCIGYSIPFIYNMNQKIRRYDGGVTTLFDLAFHYNANDGLRKYGLPWVFAFHKASIA